MIDKDADYVNWVLTIGGSYPNMKSLVQYLEESVWIYKPTKSAPAMLMEKSTGIVLTGAMKGFFLSWYKIRD